MENNVTGYIDYFRQMAVMHKDLRHNPASETGDCEEGEQRFSKISVENVLHDLNSKIGFPCLTLELYQTETDSPIVYDVALKPRGAFMVIDHPLNDKMAAEEQCYVNAETIVLHILKRIWQDHYGPDADRCTTPFNTFKFDKISITPVGPVFNREFGYRVEFDFEFQNNVDVAVAPADGVFIN